jgi:hypothetical protein
MSRVVIVLAAVLNALILAANVAWGSLLTTPFSAAGVIACVVVIVMHTRRIGILRARERELNRPRMTPEDYRRLREMEIKLGWEPSEAPASAEVPQAKAPERLTSAGIVWAGPALSGTGSLSVKGRLTACDCGKCDDAAREFGRQLREQVIASQGIPPARLSTAAELHFAELANVGRERCIGFCPICEERWLEEGRWGGNEH